MWSTTLGRALPLLALTILFVQMTDAKQVPSKFFGRFVLDRSENFDEFLAAKGVNWFLRQMIKLSSVTKVIQQNEAPGKYNMENLTSKKNTMYHGWELGKQFQAEGLDSTPHNITFDMKGDILTETHTRLNDPNPAPETYYYSISDKDELVLKMENNNITCRRWFKRQQPK